MSAIAASAIGAGISAIASGANTAINAGRSRAARSWQEKFWKKTYNQQLTDQIRLNDPSYTVGRYKASGINPYLLSEGVSYANVPTGQGGNPSAIPAAMGAPIDVLTAAQVRNIEADTENKIADAELKGSQKELNYKDLDIRSIIEKFLPQEKQAQIDKMVSEIIYNSASTEEVSKRIDNIIADTSLKSDEAQLLRAQTVAAYEYVNLEKDKVKLEAVQKELNAMGIQLSAEGVKLDAARVKLDAASMKIDFERFKVDAAYKDGIIREVHKRNNIEVANTVIRGVEAAADVATSMGKLATPAPRRVGF